MAEAVAVSCIAKSEQDIDRLDIYHATMAAMYETVETCPFRPKPSWSMPCPFGTLRCRTGP